MLPKLCYVTATIQYLHNDVPKRYVERVYASSYDEVRSIVEERQRHAYTFSIDKIEGLDV
jgi:hypothetical protein